MTRCRLFTLLVLSTASASRADPFADWLNRRDAGVPASKPTEPVVTLAVSSPGGGADDATSEFASWWNAQAGVHLGQALRDNCAAAGGRTRASCSTLDSVSEAVTAAEAVDLKSVWCGCYTSAHGPAQVFDLPRVLDNASLSMAAWLVTPTSIQAPLSRFATLEGARVKELRSPEAMQTLTAEGIRKATAQADIEEARLNELKKAAGEASVNSGGSLLAGVGGPIPGVDIDAVLNRVFSGLEKAIEERGEQEATAFVLEQIQTQLCGEADAGLPLAAWLPATCTAAWAGAFSGGPGSGGLTGLVLLKKALEADLRALPGHATESVVEEIAATRLVDGGTPFAVYAPVAEPSKELVNDILAGVHPVRALDTFGTRVGRDTKDPRLLQVACVASFPAARVRAIEAVSEANQGLRPKLQPSEQSLVALLLSLYESECRGLVGDSTAEHLARWLTDLPDLKRLALDSKRLADDMSGAIRRPSIPRGITPQEQEAARAQALARFVDDLTTALDAADQVVDLMRKLKLKGVDASGLRHVEATVRQARNVAQLVTLASQRDAAGLFSELLLHSASPVTSPGGELRGCARAPCLHLPDGLLKWGGLIVAIADAKDADGVKAAVLAAASPAGTWRTKYVPEAAPVITLGGILGFGWRGVPQLGKFSLEPRVEVPFGVDFSLLQWKYFHLGAFLQLLDLGGYSSYVNAGGVLRPFQALSPGVNLRAGIAGSPFLIVLGAGYDVDTGGPDDQKRGAAWASLGVGIDVPLFMVGRR